jgi:hypothetical protein
VIVRYWKVLHGTSYEEMRLLVDDTIYHSYPVSSILSKLHETVVCSADLSDLTKALISEKVSKVEQCLIDGASEQLQLLDLSGFVMRRLRGLEAPVDAILAH